MNIFKNLLGKLSNWKTIIAYILLLIPGASENPMLKAAIEKVLADFNDYQAWVELLIQLLLLAGIGHRLVKNLAEKKISVLKKGK